MYFVASPSGEFHWESTPGRSEAARCAGRIAGLAVRALIEEAELTPKPALVDRRGSGAHRDLTLPLMRASAMALRPTFAAIAREAQGRRPSQQLRERLAWIGRQGEQAMFAASGGANTHRGAIWALGLLVGAVGIEGPDAAAEVLCETAGTLARHPDRFAPGGVTHGARARLRYGAGGARAQAEAGFPHVAAVALPALRRARARGRAEPQARLDALLAIMAELDDTCLLHRGGEAALGEARRGAGQILAAGGIATVAGRKAFGRLERALLARHASPGGSADLLAAALFLDSLRQNATASDREV